MKPGQNNEYEITEAEELFIKLQKSVARAANRAVVFSVLWFGGIGSMFAIYFGFKCLKLLKENADVKLKGKGKALFGITLGIVGVVLFAVYWHAIITGQWQLF